MSTTTPDIVTVSVGNISDVPTMASSNLTNNNNSSNSNSTTSSSRTYTQNITNRSTIVTHFGTTNGSHGSECSSNSNTVEMEAGQSNFSSNVKSTKRFSRETEIWWCSSFFVIFIFMMTVLCRHKWATDVRKLRQTRRERAVDVITRHVHVIFCYQFILLI